MGLKQTQVLNEKSVVVGSAAVLYTLDNFASFTGIGAAKSIILTETIVPLDGEPDNAVKLRRADGIASQEVTTTFDMLEIDPVKIAALRGGIDTLVQTAGGAVAGAGQTILSGKWKYEVPVEIEGQNADGTAPTINSITGGTDGLLVVRTDYVLQKDNSTNKWSVVLTDSATITTLEQDMVIDYDYTPSAITEMFTGGFVAAGRIGIRLINRTEDVADTVVAAELSISVGAHYWFVTEYDVFYCIVNIGQTFTTKNKDDTDTAISVPMSLLGESDPDRIAGKNLYVWRTRNEIIT